MGMRMGMGMGMGMGMAMVMGMAMATVGLVGARVTEMAVQASLQGHRRAMVMPMVEEMA